MEEEIKKLKNEKKNLQKEIDEQKNETMEIQLENKKLKEEIKKLKNEYMNFQKEKDNQNNVTKKLQLENKQLKEEIKILSENYNNKIEKEKKDNKEKEELKKEIKDLIKENQNLKKQNAYDYEDFSLFNEKLYEIKQKCKEEMIKKYTNILNEKMKEIQKVILYDIQQENSQILDTNLKQIENLKQSKKAKPENKIIEKEKNEETDVFKDPETIEDEDDEDEDEEKMYSYELLSESKKDLEKNIVEFEEEEICFEFKIKNNGDIPWPENAKLIIDNNNDQKISDIELNDLKINQVQNIKINLNVENVEKGEKNYIFNFNVNGKIYGKPITLKLNVEENEKIQQFREMFSLAKEDYSDRVLYDKLKEANFNMEEAFGNIFD